MGGDGNRGFTAPPISPESTEYDSHPFNAHISSPSAPLSSSCTLQFDSVYLDTFSSVRPGLVRTPEARPHTMHLGAGQVHGLRAHQCSRSSSASVVCLSLQPAFPSGFLLPWEQWPCHAGTYSSGAHFCLPCHMNFTHAWPPFTSACLEVHIPQQREKSCHACSLQFVRCLAPSKCSINIC